MIVFGPIPSRRLGRSLGINNIPSKHCTYSCIYCQAGLTNKLTIYRNEFYSPEQIYNSVKKRLIELEEKNSKVDYITFVPDGEPTLDKNLGKSIKKIKEFGSKIAVITNSSLLFEKDVQNDLMVADWISVKIDSVNENIWHKINRPHGSLELKNILKGIEDFSKKFNGTLVTETMLVDGVNDDIKSVTATADFIKKLKATLSYILIPTRPPAENKVKPPSEEILNRAYQIFSSIIRRTELVSHYEGTDFNFSSDAEKELLSILAVHPMRIDAVEDFISRSNSQNDLVKKLIDSKIVKEVIYRDKEYLIIKNT